MVDYQKQIRPLLAARCIGCHGPGKQRSGLRLDGPAALRKGGDSGPVIVPGDSSQSLLLQRVTAADAGKRMPPRGVSLSVVDRQLLRDWIDQGAVMPVVETETERHWAFRAPRQNPLPVVNDFDCGRNPVDEFILARLESEKMRPASDASVGVRTRRVYLDLLGLLPSWETVKQQSITFKRRPTTNMPELADTCTWLRGYIYPSRLSVANPGRLEKLRIERNSSGRLRSESAIVAPFFLRVSTSYEPVATAIDWAPPT